MSKEPNNGIDWAKVFVVIVVIAYTGGWLIACFCQGKPIDPNKWITGLTLSLIFGIFFWLAFSTDLLRDIVANPAALKGKKPPYSLSRSQLAVWIAVLSSFYVYAVLWAGKTPTELNSTALTLMGISAGTFALGAVLDTSEIQQGIVRSQDNPTSGNFFTDILSDNNGISIQRFQNVAWTIVAVIIYFYNYNNEGKHEFLPELKSTLLALTGISSATYLTLKTRENVPGLAKPGELDIQLVAGDTADDTLKALLAAGINGATIRITSVSSTGVVAATLTDTPNLYIANNLPFNDYIIEVSGSQALSGGTPYAYKGKFTLSYTSNTLMPIKIQLLKAS